MGIDKKEFRVYGPPGTGKTTYLARQVQQAAEKFGDHAVLVASFTKAAASEIASRGIPVDRGNVGTLHAICYRALGSPPVAEEHIENWNNAHKNYALSSARKNMDEPLDAVGGTEGDHLMQQMEVLRAKMTDKNLWPASVKVFEDRWERWKAEIGCIDFTDMIEMAYRDIDTAPGYPTVGFFDECQDFTPLELSLVRKWAQHMSHVILVGDDDQNIYRFKGADVSAFLDYQIPSEHKRVLAQSFRVPRAVHKEAERWIRKVSQREEKDYKPRDADGEVRHLQNANFRNPQTVIRDAEKYLTAGKSIMILASCAYMLEEIRKLLRKEGLPFHNPYRRNRGDWNPLAQRKSDGLTTIDRLLTYLRPRLDARMWTAADLQAWAHLLRSKGIMLHGAKSTIELMDTTSKEFLTVRDLMTYFEPDIMPALMEVQPSWLYDNATATKKKVLEYPVRVLERCGVDGVRKKPQIVLGTIHSVKGGEADVVYIFPDLSSAGMREWITPGALQDSVIRQFYVGITRARESLIYCGPAGSYRVDLP